IRHPGFARVLGDRDDRADAVDGVLRQPRLAGGVRARGGAAGDTGDADHDLSPARGARVGERSLMRRFNLINLASLALGLAFLYLPIAILVIYSFNDSRLVTIWSGASLRWYRELFNDAAMLESAFVSFRIALLSATAATVLGTLAALALTRGRRFRGRLLFSGMIYAPLVMPEVITGLSLLLLFGAVGADRGFWTVTVAHTSLTMCFVTIIVRSRLLHLDPSLEEAALDLGCPPMKTFFSVTVPLILPALASGWMLAFTLSLD